MAAISEGEFDRWLHPNAAIAALGQAGYASESIHAVISEAIRQQKLLAAADVLIERLKNRTTTKRRQTLQATDWPTSGDLRTFWQSGELTFSTASDRSITYTGVRFEPSGIDGLAARVRPDSRRGHGEKAVAPTLTQGEFDTWIGARHVFSRLSDLGSHYALKSLLTRLSLGKVRAVAGSAVGSSGNHLEMLEIKPEWWALAPVGHQTDHLWQTGETTVKRTGSSGSRAIRIELMDVRFHPADIDAMIQRPPEAPKGHADSELFESPRVKALEAELADFKGQVARLESALKAALAVDPRGNAYIPKNIPAPLENVPAGATKPVTPAEFDLWYKAQTPDVQSWGGVKLREKCSQDHGGRRVVKKATDHITRGRALGRKKGSRNIPR